MKKWQTTSPYSAPFIIGNGNILANGYGPGTLIFSSASDGHLFSICTVSHSSYFSSSEDSANHIGSVFHFISTSCRALLLPDGDPYYDLLIKDTISQSENIFIRDISGADHIEFKMVTPRDATVCFLPCYRFTSFSRPALIIEKGDTRAVIFTIGNLDICENTTIYSRAENCKLIAVFGTPSECIRLAEYAFKKYAFNDTVFQKVSDYFLKLFPRCETSLLQSLSSLLALQKKDGSFVSSPTDTLSVSASSHFIMKALISAGLHENASRLARFYLECFEKNGEILPVYSDRYPPKPISHAPEAALAGALRCVLYYLDAYKRESELSRFSRFVKSAIKVLAKAADGGALTFSGEEKLFSEQILSLESIFDGSLAATLDLICDLEIFSRLYSSNEYSDLLDLLFDSVKLHFILDDSVFLNSPKYRRSRRCRSVFSYCEGCLSHGFENYRSIELSRSGKYLCCLCMQKDKQAHKSCGTNTPVAHPLATALLCHSPLSHLVSDEIFSNAVLHTDKCPDVRFLLKAHAKKASSPQIAEFRSADMQEPTPSSLSLSIFIISEL